MMSKADEVRELLHPFPDVWTEAKIMEANKILAIVQQLEQENADLSSKLAAAERENTERTSVAKLKAIDWRKLQDRILEQADRIRTLESALRCPQNAPIYLHFCTYCDSTLANWHQSKAAQEKKVTP